MTAARAETPLRAVRVRPRFSIGFSLPAVRAGWLRLVLPFPRRWAAIAVVGALFGVLCIPILAGWHMLDFSQEQDLFRLVINIFVIAWLLGWLVGAVIFGIIFAGMLFGREVLVARPGAIRIRIEILGLGLGAEYDAARVSNLRTALPGEKKGAAWRGPHLAFDYGGRTVRFGANIDADRGRALLGGIETALGGRLPTGPRATTDDESSVFAPAPEQPGSAAAARAETLSPVALESPSTIALLLANAAPLAGCLLFGWQLGEIMVLYWAESGVIAVFNLLKMYRIDPVGTIFSGLFFIGHFGAFMAIHFLFVYGLFVRGIDTPGAFELAPVGAMFLELWPAIAALVISHGLSFRLNFIGRGEYRGRTLRTQMAEPYTRIMVMHVTLILGAFIALALGSALPALLVLIGLKTAVDARAHLRQHGTSG